MASQKIYLADSRFCVRKKLGIQDTDYEESFSKFKASNTPFLYNRAPSKVIPQMICSQSY